MCYHKSYYHTEWTRHCSNMYKKQYIEDEEDRRFFCIDHNIKMIGNNEFYFTINGTNYRLSSRVNTMNEENTMKIFEELGSEAKGYQDIRCGKSILQTIYCALEQGKLVDNKGRINDAKIEPYKPTVKELEGRREIKTMLDFDIMMIKRRHSY